MPEIGNIGAKVDLLIRQGGTFVVSLILQNQDGSPVDLAGATLVSQIRRRALDPDPVVETFNITITNAAAGMANLLLTDDETAALVAGEKRTDPISQYVWDLELIDTLGATMPLLYGDVTVFREVTRV